MTLVAHVVREGSALTEPFIARRVAVTVPGWRSEQWSELGDAPDGTELIRVPSRLIAPGSTLGRAFHHVPQLGWRQGGEYRGVAAARRPHLLHAHYLTTGCLVATADVPLVASAYGFDVSLLPGRRLWRRSLRALSGRVAAVLVEGPHMRGIVVDLGFPPERVRIVPIAVGHEALPFEPSGPWSGRGPTLLAAGRFVEKKGFALAIRALAAIRARWPEAKLQIVGDGPLDRDLRSLVGRIGVREAVEFVGRLPRDAYLARMAGADIFLAPSVLAANGDSEGGAPTTILDAQAIGTIVVASTHADIPWLVNDGTTGYLALEGSVESLVHAVSRALDAAARWPAVADAARSSVLERHTDAALSAGLAAAYEAALR